MKTVKKLTAIILCFVMLLGVCITSASALEIGDTVEFTYIAEGPSGDDYTETWIYAGTAKEGINKVQNDNPDVDLCYEFNVEKAGYYSFTKRDSDYIYTNIAETYENGTAKNYADYILNEVEDEFGTFYYSKICYLEEGVHLIKVDVDVDYEQSFKIEYFADSITDVRFEDETDKILFEDCGDLEDSYEDMLYIWANYSIEFSNSKTVECHDINCLLDNELAKGENTVLMQLPGFEKEITIYYYETSDFIESIELSNVDNYLDAYEYYDGNYGYYNYYNEQVTVNFKDGTKQTFTYLYDGDNYITLPCGKDLWLGIYHTTDDFDESGVEKPFLVARIGETRYVEKECNIKIVSFRSNFNYFSENVSWYIERLGYWLGYNNEQLLNDGDIANWVSANIYEFKYYTSLIFDEISLFIQYYL